MGINSELSFGKIVLASCNREKCTGKERDPGERDWEKKPGRPEGSSLRRMGIDMVFSQGEGGGHRQKSTVKEVDLASMADRGATQGWTTS